MFRGHKAPALPPSGIALVFRSGIAHGDTDVCGIDTTDHTWSDEHNDGGRVEGSSCTAPRMRQVSIAGSPLEFGSGELSSVW